jgi:ribosome biogenesis GTPase A
LRNKGERYGGVPEMGYPLINVYITMENHHAINGKTHFKWQFSIAMLNYQRVSQNRWFIMANPKIKWMIWGYPHFGKSS